MEYKNLPIGAFFTFATAGTSKKVYCQKLGCRSYRYNYNQQGWKGPVHVGPHYKVVDLTNDDLFAYQHLYA